MGFYYCQRYENVTNDWLDMEKCLYFAVGNQRLVLDDDLTYFIFHLAAFIEHLQGDELQTSPLPIKLISGLGKFEPLTAKNHLFVNF